ncbi:BBE domain-containing protein [Streptomyces flavidovirens]
MGLLPGLRRRPAQRRGQRHHGRARVGIASPLSACGIFRLGGAVARVGEDETAFSGRGTVHTFNININGVCESANGFADARQWVRDSWSALEPCHDGVYVNFLMDQGAERVRQAYGEDKLRRLRALRQHYDPANAFRSNQKIAPDG